MILMYHHVCPVDKVPTEVVPLEGWRYCISPTDFRRQLQRLRKYGWTFVSLETYVAGLETGETRRNRWLSVTFDDGWLDNFQYAVPILTELSVPGTIFVVAGAMAGVPAERRMTVSQLRQLSGANVEVGAHTRTHPNLPTLGDTQLQGEIGGAKQDLEQLLARPVRYLAYPGGRFNQRVVESVQSAGYDAACSVIGGGWNSAATRYWLYRDVFTDEMNSLKDRVKSSPVWRNLLHWRAERCVRQRLHGR